MHLVSLYMDFTKPLHILYGFCAALTVYYTRYMEKPLPKKGESYGILFF